MVRSPQRSATNGLDVTTAAKIDPQLDAIKRRCDRDGFVILHGHLAQAEPKELRDQAEPLARELLAARDGDGGKFRDVAKGLYKMRKAQGKESPWFAEQLRAGRHEPLMKTPIGDELPPAIAAWFDHPFTAPAPTFRIVRGGRFPISTGVRPPTRK